MKIFKNTKAKKDAKIAKGLKSFLVKFKIKEKVARANKWAEANKKRTSCITIGVLLLSLIVGSWLTLTARQNEAQMLSGLSDVKPMFEGMHRIQKVKSMQVEQTTEMTNKGKQLKHELDSLIALPVKTHKDSTDIIVKYKQLELVVKYLDNDIKESQAQ